MHYFVMLQHVYVYVKFNKSSTCFEIIVVSVKFRMTIFYVL